VEESSSGEDRMQIIFGEDGNLEDGGDGGIGWL
jgi:hypothetical protein